MVKITLRGREYECIRITGTHGRLAVLYKNNVITALRKLGVKDDDTIIDIEPAAFRRITASATWYLDGRHLHYSCNKGANYAENLYLISKVVEYYVNGVMSEKIPTEEFFEEFTEDPDIAASRKEARKELGLDEETEDFELITKAYKNLAKQHHPDMASGDEARFKAINKAHKTLKRELT